MSAPTPQIEPPADIRQAATITRQVFVGYTGAGFTDDQALELTIAFFDCGGSQ